MNTPTNPISLRITDDEMALLDSRVGIDGARNRSDVIRAAIRAFLDKQPLLPDMDTVTIPLGRSLKAKLGDLYEMYGTTPEFAALQGMQEYVHKLIAQDAQLNEILSEGLAEARDKTTRRKEFTE
ncbi:MAG: ribbon-helix-helix domain-containing protein [Euryarchaeota archaeon]|jgi:predicted transcriptional regulator